MSQQCTIELNMLWSSLGACNFMILLNKSTLKRCNVRVFFETTSVFFHRHSHEAVSGSRLTRVRVAMMKMARINRN